MTHECLSSVRVRNGDIDIDDVRDYRITDRQCEIPLSVLEQEYGLVDGQSIYAQVVAFNDLCASVASAEMNGAINPTCPDPVRDLSRVDRDTRSIEVCW